MFCAERQQKFSEIEQWMNEHWRKGNIWIFDSIIRHLIWQIDSWAARERFGIWIALLLCIIVSRVHQPCLCCLYLSVSNGVDVLLLHTPQMYSTPRNGIYFMHTHTHNSFQFGIKIISLKRPPRESSARWNADRSVTKTKTKMFDFGNESTGREI